MYENIHFEMLTKEEKDEVIAKCKNDQTDATAELMKLVIKKGNLHVEDINKMPRDKKNELLLEAAKAINDIEDTTLPDDSELIKKIAKLQKDDIDKKLLAYAVDLQKSLQK